MAVPTCIDTHIKRMVQVQQSLSFLSTRCCAHCFANSLAILLRHTIQHDSLLCREISYSLWFLSLREDGSMHAYIYFSQMPPYISLQLTLVNETWVCKHCRVKAQVWLTLPYSSRAGLVPLNACPTARKLLVFSMGECSWCCFAGHTMQGLHVCYERLSHFHSIGHIFDHNLMGTKHVQIHMCTFLSSRESPFFLLCIVTIPYGLCPMITACCSGLERWTLSGFQGMRWTHTNVYWVDRPN